MKNFRYQNKDGSFTRIDADNLSEAMRKSGCYKEQYWQVFENGAWVWCV